MLEKHELVERIVPLHEEDSPWQGSTEIFVPVVRIPAHTTLCTALGVRHLDPLGVCLVQGPDGDQPHLPLLAGQCDDELLFL